ncbi:MAG TPA: phenylalanine--tRNA ligase subunit alpha, partial [Flavihumibacter sp.]
MESILQQIESYKTEISALEMNGAASLEEYRIKYLSTKGIVKSLFAEMKNVPADRKKEFGAVLNSFKQFAEEKYETWKQALEDQQETAESNSDF